MKLEYAYRKISTVSCNFDKDAMCKLRHQTKNITVISIKIYNKGN